MEVDEPPKTEEEPVAAKEGEVSQEEKTLPRRLINWKIFIISFPIALVIAVIGITVYFFLSPGEKKKEEKKEIPVAAAPMMLELNGLSTVVTDTGGKERLIFFNLAIIPGLNKNQLFSPEDPELRALVVRTVTETISPDFFSPLGRERVKKMVKENLERERGPDCVKAIYITSWTVL